MNPVVVARLVELAEKATLPWEIHVSPETFRVFLDQPDSIREIEMEPDDAELMVAAVNAVVPLAEDWKRMREAIAAMPCTCKSDTAAKRPRPYTGAVPMDFETCDRCAALDLKEEPAQ
jgi:hypothetical protein